MLRGTLLVPTSKQPSKGLSHTLFLALLTPITTPCWH